MTEEFVTVGKLGRPRGVRGELYITPLTDFPDRFLRMEEMFLRVRDRWERVKVDSARIVGGRPVVKLEGIDSPEKAARLSNREIGVTKDQVVELPQGSHYIFDLVGCAVFEEGTGLEIGEITGVETYPANDVYEIKGVDGKRSLLAAVSEFVKSVDTVNRKVVVNRAGLIEP